MSYQNVTGTLNPGGHPGSYNGQDAYNDMLITGDAHEKDAFVHRGGETAQTLDASYYKGPGARNGKEREIIAEEPIMMSDRKGHNGISSNGISTTLTSQEKERPIISIGSALDESASRNPILRVLRETYGAEALVEWGTAILAALQRPEVLQQELHDDGDCKKPKNGNELDVYPQVCPTIVAGWLLRDMWKREERGCASQRRQSSKQRLEQPSAAVPELPHESTQATKLLLNMWAKGEGLGLLQQALYQIQEIRESVMGKRKGGGDAMTSVVRRLTPLE